MAGFIQREIGRSADFETIIYLGYPDIRAFIMLNALYDTHGRYQSNISQILANFVPLD
jgi:hypothetical protein